MRRPTIGGLVLVLVAAGVLVGLQPVRAAWWHSADPDGAYVGNSLNILLGNHTHYLDHPGLATQDALAVGFGAQYLIGKATGRYADRQSFAEEQMLNLDSARALYRAWALFLFFGGALLVFAVVSRLLGHWTWGVAGGVLFVSAPSLAAIAPLLRPDNAVAALCLVGGYFAVTGFERRSAARYTAAALLLGFAMTFKLTAIGMAVPLVAAAVWRPPAADWFGQTASVLGRHVRRHMWWLAPTALAWLVLAWIFNSERIPILQTDDQRSMLVNGATFLAGYTLFSVVTERLGIPWADRIFRTSFAWLMLAFALGLALPASLVLDDGVQMLVSMKETLTGDRVNEGIEPFADFTLSSFFRSPLSSAGAIMALGLVAGVVGVVRRCWWPTLLATGTLVLATMAAARYSYDYYYAPAVAVAIPGALWLLRRAGRPGVPVYVWPLVLLAFSWTATHQTSRTEWERNRAVDAAAQELADELLAPGEVVLVSGYYFPIEDVRFDSLVAGFADHVPPYPYRFLSRPPRASEGGLTAAYYVALAGDLPSDQASIDIAGHGPFVVEPLPIRWGPVQEYGVVRILESPPVEP